MKVAIVVPPLEATGQPWPQTSVRETARADELAEAMRAALAIDVPVIEGPLSSAPADGYLLAFGVPATIDPALARRIIAFDESRTSVMQRLEQHGFAGAVEMHRYFQWCTKRDSERGYGLIGKREIAARISAVRPSGPYSSAHYEIITSDTARDLPGLIAEYLRAYDAAP